MTEDGFFIGWAARPGRAAIVAAGLLIAACWSAGVLVATHLDDPSASLFAFGARSLATAPESLDDMRPVLSRAFLARRRSSSLTYI